MPPVVRPRTQVAAPIVAAAQPVVNGQNAFRLFDTSSYVGGKDIAEGDYAIALEARMHQPTDSNGKAYPNSKPRVGVMFTCYPLDGGEPQEKFVALGTKADGSWAPRADGLHFVPVAGGPGHLPSNKSNWVFLMESMLQAGLPAELADADFSAINGTWAHVKSVPEPEERKSYGKKKGGASTGEAAMDATKADDEPRGSGLIPSVVSFLDGGKAWEGGGGFPEAAAEAAPAAPVVNTPPARRRVAPAAAAAVAAPQAAAPSVPAGEADELSSIVLNEIGNVLGDAANVNGLTLLKLRIGVNSALVKAHGVETATAIMDQTIGNDAVLSGLLGQVGYKKTGVGPTAQIGPA